MTKKDDEASALGVHDRRRRAREYAEVTSEIKIYSATEWSRSGFKKLDTVEVKGRHQTVRVTVRFDKHDSMFAAELEGVTFKGRDLKAVEVALGKHLATVEAYEFRRYIEIDYDRTHESQRHGIQGRSWWGARGEDERPVSGIRLEFDVYEVTEPFVTRSGCERTTARVWRRLRWDEAGAIWITGAEEVRNDSSLTGLIPFTQERLDVLVAIKTALQGLDAKLWLLFGDKVKDVGRMLDQMDMKQLPGGQP